MKALLVLAVATPLVLATGCASRVEHERVVEKPVVQKETVIRQAPADSPVVVERVPASPRGCSYAASAYSAGSISCQSNEQYRCDDGVWRGLNTAC